jgi:hypothetical protein
MYFGLVLVYPALRFINDISLMNFSAQPHGGLLYVAMVRFNSPGLLPPVWFPSSHRFNPVIRFPASAVLRFPFLLGLQR